MRDRLPGRRLYATRRRGRRAEAKPLVVVGDENIAEVRVVATIELDGPSLCLLELGLGAVQSLPIRPEVDVVDIVGVQRPVDNYAVLQWLAVKTSDRDPPDTVDINSHVRVGQENIFDQCVGALDVDSRVMSGNPLG